MLPMSIEIDSESLDQEVTWKRKKPSAKGPKRTKSVKEFDPLALYFKQISKFPLLTVQEEQGIGEKIVGLRAKLKALEKERETKQFKFPEVLPMVFYIGSSKWTVPLSLKEMFYGHDLFGGYLLNFNCGLVDVKGYDNESVKGFQSRLLKVMMMLEKSKGFVEILEKLERQHRRCNELKRRRKADIECRARHIQRDIRAE